MQPFIANTMKTRKPVSVAISKPSLRSDGTCSGCSGGWLCKWCQQDGLRRDREQSAMLRSVSAQMRQDEIYRTCARFELESDEMLTREQKAELILT